MAGDLKVDDLEGSTRGLKPTSLKVEGPSTRRAAAAARVKRGGSGGARKAAL